MIMRFTVPERIVITWYTSIFEDVSQEAVFELMRDPMIRGMS